MWCKYDVSDDRVVRGRYLLALLNHRRRELEASVTRRLPCHLNRILFVFLFIVDVVDICLVVVLPCHLNIVCFFVYCWCSWYLSCCCSLLSALTQPTRKLPKKKIRLNENPQMASSDNDTQTSHWNISQSVHPHHNCLLSYKGQAQWRNRLISH